MATMWDGLPRYSPPVEPFDLPPGPAPAHGIDRLSIEVTRACSKACWFCYSGSTPEGATHWTVDELVAFVSDCAANGVRAASFGGGEPLQFPGIFELLARLRGVVFRSFTTNGLLLDEPMLARVAEAAPDKVHVSIHFPDRIAEVERVISNVRALEASGIRAGVNLLVAQSKVAAAAKASALLREAGIGNDRIVYLPMRGTDSPSPADVARAAGNTPFQSMTCLTRCAKSPRFVSIGWDRTVAWCSYTTTRASLARPDFAAMRDAILPLGLSFCGQAQPVALGLRRD